MIHTNNEKNRFILETETTAYALSITELGNVAHGYWGKRLNRIEDYPQVGEPARLNQETNYNVLAHEYAGWSQGLYLEPSLKCSFQDHTRDVVLKFAEYQIKENALILTLRDAAFGLAVDLIYRPWENYDLIERKVVLRNESDFSIQLQQVLSARFTLPTCERYQLTQLVGKWGGETQLSQTELSIGKHIWESRRGITSHFANPFFALGRQNPSETHGDVWFGLLAFSGNWKSVVEANIHGQVFVSMGINDFDFSWKLEPHSSFETPRVIAGFSAEGYGRMSRMLHRFQRETILPESTRQSCRPVLYNSWEATEFHVNEPDQCKLAEKAASLGIELFVIDDGWFGARNHDRAGLGDWHVNPEKFPRGLGPLIQKVQSLGMKFGIWVEPEMVNPDSDLFRAHPDWVYHFPKRTATLYRNQLALNVCRPDVQKYIIGFMTKLLSENAIDFVKWDMNRSFSEPGWPEIEPARQQEIWIRHAQSIYEIFKTLRGRFPNVSFESCASGGGRVDLGTFEVSDQVWTSDNTDPYDRLFIQEGFSYPYCARAMMAWVTDSPNFANERRSSLRYRFHSSMMGSLGVGGNLPKWSDDEMNEARQWITAYKQYRHIVANGDLYRLASPRQSPLSAVQYVSPDKKESLLFTFLHSARRTQIVPRIYPRGLQSESLYKIQAIHDTRQLLDLNPNEPLSGAALMARGFRVALTGDFDSALWLVDKAG